MTLVAIMTVIGLCVAVKAADAHRPGLHSPGTLDAPRLHWLISARQETNGVARSKCRARPYRAIRPARLVPEFARQFTIRVELSRLELYRVMGSKCLPTSPEGIIRYVFPAGTEDAAVRVAYCESRLWPWARNPSGASGLFQLMPHHWAGRFNPFNAWSNTRYAYRLSDAGTNWSAWVCSP